MGVLNLNDIQYMIPASGPETYMTVRGEILKPPHEHQSSAVLLKYNLRKKECPQEAFNVRGKSSIGFIEDVCKW